MRKTLTVTFEHDLGWVLQEAAAGPAGEATLELSGQRVAVDVLDPDRLVEWAIFADRPGDRLPEPALHLLRRCFGDTAVLALQARCADEPQILSVEPSAGWREVGAVAIAEFVLSRRRPATALAALDVVRAARRVGVPVIDELSKERAWEALPAVAAVARAACLAADIVDAMGVGARSALREHLAELHAVLGEGVSEPVVRLFHDLQDLLTPIPDLVGGLLGSPYLEEPAGAIRGTNEPVSICWTGSPEELKTTLGGSARDAFAGIEVSGQVPGVVWLRFPLRPGASIGTFAALNVRILTWSGELLASGEPKIATRDGALPVVECRLRAQAPADRQSVVNHGVVVDLAAHGRPLPGAPDLQRLAHRRAQVAGQEAVLAERAGESGRAARLWRRCAMLSAAAGHLDDAATARAAAAQNAAAAAQNAEGRPGDWLAQLERAWRAEAARRIADHDSDDDDLRALIRDLAIAFPALPEVARAHTVLAQRLAGSDDEEDRDSAALHLSAVLSISLDLGDEARAAAALRALAEQQNH
jgi:hypothetical protein